jgi:hypothetical protein
MCPLKNYTTLLLEYFEVFRWILESAAKVLGKVLGSRGVTRGLTISLTKGLSTSDIDLIKRMISTNWPLIKNMVLQPTPLKGISSRDSKLKYKRERYVRFWLWRKPRYLVFRKCSVSHVASSVWWLHYILYIFTFCLLVCLSFQSNTLIGYSASDWSGSICVLVSSIICASGICLYFFNCETWNTSCTAESRSGSRIR